MVFYVRFLKTPRLQKQKAGALSVSALVCITTDLGDAFLAQDVHLLATLSTGRSEKALYQEKLKWTAGKRELPILLGPFPEYLSRQTLVLGLSAIDARRPETRWNDHLSGESSIPLVISGWSAPFGGPQFEVAEKLVERRFGPTERLDLRIWEETGNSIARHIWDAALASVIYFEKIVQSGPEAAGSVLADLLQNPRTTPLNVLELGSGCGIVGIALAELIPQCSVLLTDLPEVEEIVTHNITAARPALSSKVEFRTLDWDEPPPEDLCRDPIDLILISDCTYNADSLPALVSVLDRLVQTSPKALILVALKRRHESEAVFFDLMQSAGFCNQHQAHTLSLPSQHEQFDHIELHCYGRSNK